MMWLIDETILYFLMAFPAIIMALIFFLIIWKMGPQARKLGKANIRKRATAVMANEAGQLDIVAGKITSSGHLQQSRRRAYEILHSGNPTLGRKFHWKGTGIPVFIGDIRKSVVVSPHTLTAIEIVDSLKDKLGDDEYKELKKVAENTTLDVLEETHHHGEITKKLKTLKLLALDPLKLKSYFSNALDSDAQDVIIDKAYQKGLQDAGRQATKMGLAIGVCVAIGLVIVGIILVGGGVI